MDCHRFMHATSIAKRFCQTSSPGSRATDYCVRSCLGHPSDRYGLSQHVRFRTAIPCRLSRVRISVNSSARNFVCSLIRCRQSPKRTCSLCRACNRVGNGQVGPESRGLRARLGSACVVAVTELVVAERTPVGTRCRGAENNAMRRELGTRGEDCVCALQRSHRRLPNHVRA